jgi:hypothetical protein
MKRLLPILFFAFLARLAPAAPVPGEHIILVGGPSLLQWEKYKPVPHDHWWANFVHSARIRTEQIHAEAGPDAMITWLVYAQGYKDRAAQENQDLISFIDSVRDKFQLNLIYFDKGDEVINYLNNGQPRDRLKVASFEYIGHSNAKCFMFDYSSNIESACKSWLHESELKQINGRIFARGAFIKSWGCHTGESMSKKWRAATGTTMLGAIGKTDFSTGELPILSSPNGKWVTGY